MGGGGGDGGSGGDGGETGGGGGAGDGGRGEGAGGCAAMLMTVSGRAYQFLSVWFGRTTARDGATRSASLPQKRWTVKRQMRRAVHWQPLKVGKRRRCARACDDNERSERHGRDARRELQRRLRQEIARGFC